MGTYATLHKTQRDNSQNEGKSETADQYLGIAAIFIESYALETAWNLAFCVSCNLKYAPLDNFFAPTVIQVDVSLPFFFSLALYH
jgi:hypothetical protein